MTFPPDIIEKVKQQAKEAWQKTLAKGETVVLANSRFGQPILDARDAAIQAAISALSPASAAVKEEREACAKVIESYKAAYLGANADLNYGGDGFCRGAERACDDLAQAIRARSALATGKGK